MNRIKLLFRYLYYLSRSTNAHGVHSPFVYDLITQVIYSQKDFYSFNKIDLIREHLLVSEQEVSIQDFGAGSHLSNATKKKVKHIALNAAKPKKYGELLFRLVNKFQPKSILELGTSLGLSGIYLASAHKKAHFVSIEGSSEISEIAKQNFMKLGLQNAEIIQGTFEEKLASSIQKFEMLDFVFFDGNHSKEPTLAYFHECLKKANSNSVFVFDDIHWSVGMEQAWNEIKNHNTVTVTIDLFFLGIVFFRKEQVKENFVIRY